MVTFSKPNPTQNFWIQPNPQKSSPNPTQPIIDTWYDILGYTENFTQQLLHVTDKIDRHSTCQLSMKVIIQLQTVEYFMTLKISRSQVSTQPNPPKLKKLWPNPTQPNPWMDPTHGRHSTCQNTVPPLPTNTDRRQLHSFLRLLLRRSITATVVLPPHRGLTRWPPKTNQIHRSEHSERTLSPRTTAFVILSSGCAFHSEH